MTLSGLEALGAISASFQLAEASIKIASAIIEIYRSRPPETIRRHLREISSLQEVASLIGEDRHSQTTLVCNQLNYMLFQANALRRTLERLYKRMNGSYWSIVIARTEEKEILLRFETLEREKATLNLYPSTTQSHTLSRIDHNVKGLVSGHYPNMADTKVSS